MKKDLAEVKAYAEAMADSNRARDAYVDKEQDKFFRQVDRQQADIDALKECMERSELRVRAFVSVPLATLMQTSLGLYRSPTGPGR